LKTIAKETVYKLLTLRDVDSWILCCWY